MTAGAPGRRRDRVADEFGQSRGRGQRRTGPFAFDRLGDPQGEAFLTELRQHPGQLMHRVGVDDLGRGDAVGSGPSACRAARRASRRSRARPHRAASTKRRGRTGRRRRCRLVEPELAQHGRHLVVDGVHEVHARGERGQPLAAARQRLRVAIETDQGELADARSAAPGRGRRDRRSRRPRRSARSSKAGASSPSTRSRRTGTCPPGAEGAGVVTGVGRWHRMLIPREDGQVVRR